MHQMERPNITDVVHIPALEVPVNGDVPPLDRLPTEDIHTGEVCQIGAVWSYPGAVAHDLNAQRHGALAPKEQHVVSDAL